MYNIKFILGDNDVIRCRIYDGVMFDYIKLEQKSLYNILNALAFRHKEINSMDDSYSYVTFENIKGSELKYLIEQEKEREQEEQIYKEEKENQKFKPTPRKNTHKVVRKNRFKKNTIIVASTATVMLLAGIGLTNIGITRDNPKSEISYEPPVSVEEIITEPQTNDNYEYENYNENQNQNVNNEEIIDLNVEENTQNEKYLYCKNNYGDLITKYANIYGIDPNLAIAVFTHERGYHSDVMDPGGAIGLCQVQLDVWNNQDVKAYNFETNNWDTYHIKEENIKNLEENIKAGVMILQDSLRQVSYMVFQGVQNYNYGLGNLNVAFRNSGLNSEQLNEQNNKDWLQYRDLIKGGDPQYIEHVFQYIPSDTTLHFKTPDGQEINLHYVAQKNLSM